MPPRRRTARSRATPPRPAPAPGEGTWLLDVPFADRALATQAGARWDAELRLPVFTGAALPPALEPYLPQPFSLEALRAALEGAHVPTVPPPTRRLVPRPHQLLAAHAIARAEAAGLPGFVLMDEVGTGKTLSAWEGARQVSLTRPLRHVLVVCPLAVVPHWRHTIADQGDLGARVVVVNYDRLKSLLEVPVSAGRARRTSTRNRRIAADGASLVDWDLVVFDEAHKLKSYGHPGCAQRASAAATLARYADAPHGPFVLWASATAGSTPTELGYLAPLLAAVTGDQVAAVTDYGRWLQGRGFAVTRHARSGAVRWEPNEADVAAMRGLLLEHPVPVALRRLPDGAQVSRLPVPVVLDPEQQRRYEATWTAFRRELELARRGRDARAGFVATLRFRQKASLLRVEGTVAQVEQLLDNDRQVALSVQFLETADALVAALTARGVTVALMDGRDPQQREQQRLAFQRGDAPVVVFTPVEGFSLHAGEQLPDGTRGSLRPRTTVVHDPRWSAIEAVQLEGRCHRDGQVAPALWTYAQGTVEQAVVASLLSRIATMKDLAGDDPALLEELEGLLERGEPGPVDPQLLPGVGMRIAPQQEPGGVRRAS